VGPQAGTAAANIRALVSCALEIRAGRRERARQLFTDLRQTEIKTPAIAPALVEFAEFEIDDGRFDEAIAILDDARLLRPEPTLLTRIDFLSAQAQYSASDSIPQRCLRTNRAARFALGEKPRCLTHPAAGCRSVITLVSSLITTNWKNRAATNNRVPICNWRKV
jgi:hypothetical protein